MHVIGHRVDVPGKAHNEREEGRRRPIGALRGASAACQAQGGGGALTVRCLLEHARHMT